MQSWDQQAVEKQGIHNNNCITLQQYQCKSLYYSLLDILAGRKDKRGLRGTVLINGQEQPRNFKCISGYVVQVMYRTD